MAAKEEKPPGESNAAGEALQRLTHATFHLRQQVQQSPSPQKVKVPQKRGAFGPPVARAVPRYGRAPLTPVAIPPAVRRGDSSCRVMPSGRHGPRRHFQRRKCMLQAAT